MKSIFERNRTAVITGASAGIGLELARQIAPKLDALVLVARRVDRLQHLSSELRLANPKLAVHVEAADLSEAQGVDSLLAAIDRLPRPVDILINNAGLGEYGLFERVERSRISQVLAVNINALVMLTHYVLPGMVQRGHGGIINIGSGAGHAAMPKAPVYTATKHFVKAFTESLRAQVMDAGITVCEIAPGPVDTEFDTAAGIQEGFPGREAFRITAAECAREILEGFERRVPVLFPGRNYRLMMKAQPLMPRAMLVAQLRSAARKERASRAKGARS